MYVHGAERLAKIDHAPDASWLGTTFGVAQENQELEETLEDIVVTSPSGETSITLPDVLYRVQWGEGSITYEIASQFNPDPSATYTILQTIPLYSTSQQFETIGSRGSVILVSIADLLGLTEQEAPTATIGNYDPYDVTMTLPIEQPVPEVTYYIYDYERAIFIFPKNKMKAHRRLSREGTACGWDGLQG